MVEAIIFDMDGVISDTQKLHAQVEADLLSRFGVLITPEEVSRRFAGVRTKDFFGELLAAQDQIYDLDELMKEKWILMEKLASQVEAINGSIELIKHLHARKVPLAVASASNAAYVKKVLAELEISEMFTAIVSGDMVSKGKPDPESFLRAASELHVDPEHCLVVEDGRSGMEGARRAGMYCIALVNNIEEDYPTPNRVRSLLEISDEYLLNVSK